MDRLNILVLYQMGDPRFWRKAVRDLEFMLPDYAPGHNYIIHDAAIKLPDFIKAIEFHGIVLGPTFLCNRYRSRSLRRVKKVFDFIRTSNAFKIAMPQDDYDCSAILDGWMVEWNIDLLYTVCPDHWDILYPRFKQTGRIRLGYTGYVSDDWLTSWDTPKAFHDRDIDVSYRASKLAPNFGRIGYTKGVIGDRFKNKVQGSNLKLDISTDNRDMIPGAKWHDFIENSKFCLATNSGSSLLDSNGMIRKSVVKYVKRFPNATFEEVENECFPGEDGKYLFTAISPRHMEAGLALTVQLCTPGDYNGILEACKHYIPLEPDCSNIKEVLAVMQDDEKVSLIAKACKEAILSIDALRFKNHVSEIISKIGDATTNRHFNNTNREQMSRFISAHRNLHTKYSNHYWKRYRILKQIKLWTTTLVSQRLI